MPQTDNLEDLLKKVAADLYATRERLRETERRAAEPIAIVGVGCRFPGGVTSAEGLWKLLSRGGDATAPFPRNRGWDTGSTYGSAAGDAGGRRGGFVDGADLFDAAFFGISPREALAMDPQQRLLLETAWEALESAGIPPDKLAGTDTATFVGTSASDYSSLVTSGGADEGYAATGTGPSVVSGRLAYVLGLEGPAMSVDTACSSSLVALHLAVQALRGGECSLALVGGVTVMSTPFAFTVFARQNGLAADGRCKAFADGADGTGWGEGCGVLVVERLSDAQRRNRTILAVIRGSAVNQDGASSGLTAPNGPAQQRVMRQALTNAGLTPSDVDVVEAHGTGTRLGDPVEAQAVLATYGQGRDRPLWLGSIKSNIGHTQAAAGVAGLIKMVMAMRHEELPRSLHIDRPTTHVDWDSGAVSLLIDEQPWPHGDRPRRAAVSAFGISGTNAHVVLEEPPAAPPVPSGHGCTPVPLVLSARTEEALAEQEARVRAAVPASAPLRPVASTLLTRSVFEHRSVLLDRDTVTGSVSARTAPRVVFLFSGQGSQRPGMGAQLAEVFPVFADLHQQAWNLLDTPSGLDVHDTGRAQPALFALQVALFGLMRSWGVHPDAVIGHSIGELAAAYAAGVWSLEDACTLVSARARLMQALPAGGAMAAVVASEREAEAALRPGVEIAAVNGPSSVVLSGDEDAVLACAAELGKFTRLSTSHAFHSSHVDPILDDYRAVAERLTYRSPELPVAAGEQVTTSGYWVRQLREPVRFGDQVAAYEGAVFVEIGPGRSLSRLVDGLPLLDGSDEPRAAMTALAELFVRGVDIDWPAVLGMPPAPLVDLPTYAFQRRRYWVDGVRAADPARSGLTPADHPMLSTVTAPPETDEVFVSGRLSLDTHPWLADHVVAGAVLLPGTAFVELALRAGREVGCDTLDELIVEKPLIVPRDGGTRLHVSVGAEDENLHRTVYVFSRRDGSADWVRHAQGVLTVGVAALPEGLVVWPPAGAEPVDLDGAYPRLAERGYQYGPAFQGMRSVWTREDEVFAEVALPPDVAEQAKGFVLHPVLLEAALHTMFVLGAPDDNAPSLPSGFNELTIRGADAVTALRVRIVTAGDRGVTVDIADSAGNSLATVGGLTKRPVPLSELDDDERAGRNSLLRVAWQVVPERSDAGLPTVALLGDGEVAGALREAGVATREHPGWPAYRDDLTQGADPAKVVVMCPPQGRPPDAALDVAADVLEVVQDLVRDEDVRNTRLVVVTRDAVCVRPGDEVAGVAQSAVWGLVRSAQAEHPERFALVDLDGTEASRRQLGPAIAANLPQMAIRDGVLHRLHLAADPAPDMPGVPGKTRHIRELALKMSPPWDREGTVLITGGTGVVGGTLARHLVHAHGMRHLLLASRRGPEADGADKLVTELTATDARVRVVACDVSDPAQIQELVEDVPGEHPLTAVIHCAGVPVDGVVEELTHKRLAGVYGPEVGAAWHLHRCTEHLPLSAFVMCSAVVGTLGSAGQAGCAAAYSFLDALAHYRASKGLPAQSLAWDLWAPPSGMSSRLDDQGLARLTPAGMGTLTPQDGIALFDEAQRRGEPHLIPIRLYRAALATSPHPLLRALAPPVPATAPADQRPAAPSRGPADDLATMPPAQQHLTLLTLIRDTAALVLGHGDTTMLTATTPFKDLGVDSVTAVELRDRLAAATDLRLPATLVFDYPTPEHLVTYLRGRLGLDGTLSQDAVAAALDAVRTVLRAMPAGSTERRRMVALLGDMLHRAGDATVPGASDSVSDLDSASDEDLFALVDEVEQ